MTNLKMEKVDAVRLVDERTEPIKQLGGFAKHHRVPTTCGDSDRRFLVDLTQRDVDDDLQEVFTGLRNLYGLKRTEISVDGPSDGVGVITTPFFNYEFHVFQNGDDPAKVLWQRLITEIREPARVFAGPFEEIFGQRFSVLEISTDESLDLEAIVDHIEDTEHETVKVDYDKDLTWCEIQVADASTSVFVRDDSIRVVSRKNVSPQELLESFLRVQQEFMSTLSLAGIPFLAGSD